MVSSVQVYSCHWGTKDKVVNGGMHTAKKEDSPKVEDNQRFEDNLKKGWLKYADDTERENDPKYCPGGEGGAYKFKFFYK